MPKPATVALSEAELRAELSAITACWEILQPLDSAARERVITWLQAWRDHEAGSSYS